ncbi:MAG TPA: YIP1 family protein [Thermomicrobiales bacterium]|jgi:hypothetical protein|nr:YIP1 family protein [Thermomicrobiales bacterium]
MYGGAQAGGAGRNQSFLNRVIGAARVDRPTYEEVERDPSATVQAAIVVVVVAIAAAIGGAGEGANGLIGGALGAMLGWVVSAGFIFLVGTRLIPSQNVEADIGQVLRTTGFAQVPGILALVGAIPVIGLLAGLVAFVWGIITMVVAIQSALEASVGRAVAIAIIAAILAAVVAFLIALIFGVTLSAF